MTPFYLIVIYGGVDEEDRINSKTQGQNAPEFVENKDFKLLFKKEQQQITIWVQYPYGLNRASI